MRLAGSELGVIVVALFHFSLPNLAIALRAPNSVLATAGIIQMQAEGTLRTALITGSTDGIGQHTAERLARDGWEVLIHGRNPQRIAATLARIQKNVPASRLHSFQADFACFADVKRLASEVSSRFPKLDLLINNAGVYEERMQTTVDGLEFVFQVNVLSPFLLTSLLLDTLEAAPEPRIIITSSISQAGALNWDNLQMEHGFSAHESYSTSKLCNAMHALELAERLKNKMPHATVNTLDPGTVNTKMLLAGWGPCGIDVSTANDQYQLATNKMWKGKSGIYTVGNCERKASRSAYDTEQRQRLWEIMQRLTGTTCL